MTGRRLDSPFSRTERLELRYSLSFGFLALLLLPSVQPKAQTGSLGDLFRTIDPAPVREPGVDIVGWIVREGNDSFVRITVTAQQGAKLVADPGITVNPIEERLDSWIDTASVSHIIEGVSYFDSPPTIDVGRVREDGQPVQVDVSYAYCLVDDICLFGEDRIAIQTRPNN